MAITVAVSASIGVIIVVISNQSKGLGDLGTTIVEPGSSCTVFDLEKSLLLISFVSPFGNNKNNPFLSAVFLNPPDLETYSRGLKPD